MTVASSLYFFRQVEVRPSVVVLGAGVAAVLSVNGGFYATSWGWTAVALSWAAVAAVALRGCSRPSPYELVFIGGFAALAVWTVLSRAWSLAPGLPPGEAERTLVYLAAALAGAVIVQRGDVRVLLGSLTTGITLIAGYALLTRVFPGTLDFGSPVAGIRLSTPVGYWNGLGIVCVMGIVLALTFVGMARSPYARAAAGATLPILATTLYFTFGRGAWLALFVALVVLVALAPDRLQLLGRAAPSATIAALLVWRASTRFALTHADAPVQVALREGHSLAALALGACLASGYAAFAMRIVPADKDLPRDVRTAARWAGVAAIVVVLLAMFVGYGGPQTVARHAYDSFVGQTEATSGPDLNSRLFTLSNNGRLSSWRVALHAFEAHPLGGIGAGSFADYWNRHRTVDMTIQDAHSLYLETAAELGIVGLVLLAATLATPFAAYRRRRDVSPVCAGAAAALAAYVVHAAADWDWELSGVTLTAILCGVAILAANRREEPAGRWRMLPLGLGTLISLLALVGLLGNLALAASAAAARRGDVAKSASDARRAHWFAPWSAVAWERLGVAQFGAGDLANARRSFRSAIAEDPGDSTLWVDLAKASAGRERVAALEQARRLDPRDTSLADIQKQLAAQGGAGQ
jgi:hypothetical protein